MLVERIDAVTERACGLEDGGAAALDVVGGGRGIDDGCELGAASAPRGFFEPITVDWARGVLTLTYT